jgi:hypothetical protein
MSDTFENKHVEVLNIPVPPAGFAAEAMGEQTEVEIEEISQGEGHFSVDYRRC